jgi:hypothetical protein
LTKVETSLTPKQAVLLWLREAQQLDSDEYTEKALKTPLHEAVLVRIPNIAKRAVRDSLERKAMAPERIEQAALEAWKQARFLIVLVLELNSETLQDAVQTAPELKLLLFHLRWLEEQLGEHGVSVAAEWELWRDLLIRTLTRLWLLRATIAAVNQQYYDGHSILFLDREYHLNMSIELAEKLARAYNDEGKDLPFFVAI